MATTNFVLIDYENVQPRLGEMLADEVFQVLVFVGATQTKVNTDTAMALQSKGSAARYVRMATSGRNALDFHIAYHLGCLSTSHPEAYLHVITADKDLDPLIEHLQAAGLKVRRWLRVEDIPLVKKPASATVDERCSQAIAYLVQRGAQRPASMKTLRGSLAALFAPKLSDADVDGMVDALIEHGLVRQVGQKVSYGLPD